MNLFSAIGMLIYVLTTLVDRIFWKLPDALMIVLSLAALALMIVGIVKNRREK